jgi:cysteine desulfurase
MPKKLYTGKFYFDYAASTPVDPAVLRAMNPYFTEKFGNPGSLHSFGQVAIAALDRARETVANSIGAQFREVIFTASATEANNLALYGAYFRFKEAYPEKTPKMIISAIEHESVIETARFLESQGAKLAIIPVDKIGIIDIKQLAGELDTATCIVSVMYVNNEIGSVQPITEISNIIQNFRSTKSEERNSKHIQKSRIKNGDFRLVSDFDIRISDFPLFHTDAAQAFCYFDCTARNLGIDLMTLSSQKIYGPKGAGALYANSKYEARNSNLSAVSPLIRGGNQEFGMRSGTENIPAIVGMGKAVESADKNREQETKRISELKTYSWRELKKIFPHARVNGPAPEQLPRKSESAAPHILNVSFPGHTSQDLLIRLDLAGFAVSAGSACTARSLEASHVLTALGTDKKRALSSIRFSFGKPTTSEEIKELLNILKKILR